MPDAITSTPTCERCGYDLAGIGGGTVVVKCPECGAETDTRVVPEPQPTAWKTAWAIVAGSASILGAWTLGMLGTQGVLPRKGGMQVMLAVGMAGVIVGASVSLAIVWHQRIARVQWKLQRRRWLFPRAAWWLVEDLAMLALMDLGLAVCCGLWWVLLTTR